MLTSLHCAQDRLVPAEENPVPANAPLALQGSSEAVRQIRQHLRRIGPYYRRALLSGEEGSGKESAARFLHGLSPMAASPFVIANAAAVAQSGAAIDAARRGTIYLEDVGSLPLPAQDLLMRRLTILDQKVRARLVETRLIGASNCDLKSLALTGQFRQDLYNFLSVVEIRMPALRDRTEDLDALLEFYTRHASDGQLSIAPEAWTILAAHSWRGNLCEFEQVLGEATAAALKDQSLSIEPNHLPQLAAQVELPTGSSQPATVARLDDVMRRHVIEVLSRCAGNKLKAAELLGISRSTLYRMLDGG